MAGRRLHFLKVVPPAHRRHAVQFLAYRAGHLRTAHPACPHRRAPRRAGLGCGTQRCRCRWTRRCRGRQTSPPAGKGRGGRKLHAEHLSAEFFGMHKVMHGSPEAFITLTSVDVSLKNAPTCKQQKQCATDAVDSKVTTEAGATRRAVAASSAPSSCPASCLAIPWRPRTRAPCPCWLA